MCDTVVLVGSKIFPPFDSAHSSIGFNLLKTLLKLNSILNQVAFISSFDLNIYVKLYNQQITYMLNDRFLDIIKKSTSKSLLIEHTWSRRDNISLDYLLLRLLKEVKKEDGRIIVQSLIPLKLSVLRNKFLMDGIRRIKFVYYLFHMPSPDIRIFGAQLYDQIIVSSQAMLYRIKCALGKHTAIVYPPIDTEFFRPLPARCVARMIIDKFRLYEELIEAKERGKTLLLYMGPVHPDRFPISIVIRLLRLLKQQGLDPLLVVVTTVRYVGEDDKYVSLWRSISKRLNRILKVYVRALGEEEKLALYNLADAVLYPVIRPWSMAIPPLTVLEAYACAKPIVLTSCVLGYREIVPKEFDCLVALEPTIKGLIMALKNALNLSTRDLYKLRSFCTRRHSIDAVGKRLLAIYKELWN